MKTIDELLSRMGTDAGWDDLSEAVSELRILRQIVRKGKESALDTVSMTKEQLPIYSEIVKSPVCP